MRLSDAQVERVADLKDFQQTGYWDDWMGLDPRIPRFCCATQASNMFMLWTPEVQQFY